MLQGLASIIIESDDMRRLGRNVTGAVGPRAGFEARRSSYLLLLATGLVIFSSGCLHRHQRVATQYPPPVVTSTRPGTAPAPPARAGKATAAGQPAAPIIQGEEGIASWYGHPYHGRPTASGEIYNMYVMTAAHRTLPFGTRVRVHDLENGKSVEVRINDRGPFVEGRIIDLSYAAAQAMGMPGTALVRLDILGYGTEGTPAPPPGVFTVQVGAFQDPENARRLKARIERSYGPVTIESFDRGDGMFHRVRVGRVDSEDAARALAEKLQRDGFATDTFIVRVN